MTYYKNKKNTIDETQLNLYNIFNLNNTSNFINKTHEYNLVYVEYNNMEISCKIYEDFNNIIYIILIVVPICYLILIVYLICVYCRYRKIYSQYSRLREESQGDNQTSNNEREINKIELGNMSKIEK